MAAAESKSSQMSSSSSSTGPQKARRKKHVLLVDDNNDTLSVVKSALARRSVSAKVCADPFEALDYLRRHRGSCDMVVSDIRMPQMSGFEFVRHAKEVAPEVKVMFMTAFDIHPSEFGKVFPSTKVEGFIKKLATIEEFCNTVVKNLDLPAGSVSGDDNENSDSSAPA